MKNNYICTPNYQGQLAQLVADDTEDIVSTGKCRHADKQSFVSIRAQKNSLVKRFQKNYP